MTVESASYVNQLDSAKPSSSDSRAEGDDHMRLIKAALLASFPAVGGAVSASHTELSYVDGVTSAIQTQIDAKAPIDSPALTGTPTAPTATVGSGTNQVATTAFVQTAVATATNQSWATTSTATSKTLASLEFCRVTASGQTISFPASPVAGVSRVGIEFASGVTGTLNPGSNKIKGSSGTMSVNKPGMTLTFTYLDSTVGWVIGG